jgi:hypothetical protein
MTDQKLHSPLKVGLLIVAISYFLFTLHALFTLQWIGEWNYLTGSFSFFIYVTDISALIGLIFRFIASIIAVASVMFYFSKGFPSTEKAFKILRWILVFEGIYWLGLLTTSVMSVQGLGNQSVISMLSSLALSGIPLLVESIVLPIALFIFAWKLNPNKPLKQAVKWGLITGTIYIFVFWLTNTSMWIITLLEKGNGYLTSYPENLLSFILTIFGLLALAIYTAYFTKKSSGAESGQELKLKTVGAIIIALGMYFLWNYLTWIFFGGDYLWSDWYAWFLGHNLDLWMLSLPLLGLPLLFTDKPREKIVQNMPDIPRA